MKKIIIIVSLFVIFGAVVYYSYNFFTIDTQYAMRFGNVLCDYNIEQTDEFFNDTTKIISGNKESTYLECRENVIHAFREKKFHIYKNSSYGYGDNQFNTGIQKISIRLMGTYIDETFGECIVTMKLKQKGMFNYSIESIESDSELFRYIFLGEGVK